MPSRVTLPSAKLCFAGARCAWAAPIKLSRQAVTSAVMCTLTLPLSTACVARDLIHAASSTCALPYARVAEDSFPSLALGLIGPFLSQMIAVFLNYGKAGIVPSVWRFQSGDASKGKCQRLLRIGNGGRHHLGLILRRAVVGGNQVIAVDREHRNHYGSALGSKLLH